jgi:hypothetical protein
MHVVVWLRGLGLGKYEAAFRENDIDETILPSLTHETLKDLGVTSVGHRLKLLMPLLLCVKTRPARRPPPKRGPRQVPQGPLPNTAQSVGK